MEKMPEGDRVELSKKKIMPSGRPKAPDKTENQRDNWLTQVYVENDSLKVTYKLYY